MAEMRGRFDLLASGVLGIPADQRDIQHEVAICSADGLPDWQHDSGVDEDTDGHGPWYSLDTWERMQNLTADQRTADRETIARVIWDAGRHDVTWQTAQETARHRGVPPVSAPVAATWRAADAVLAVLVPADLIRAGFHGWGGMR